MNADSAVPVCPASPSRLRAFISGGHPDASDLPSNRWLRKREEQIHDLRAEGLLSEAERFGWLSIAGFAAGIGHAKAVSIDPSSPLLHQIAGRDDLLSETLGDEPEASLGLIPNTGIEVRLATDPLGYSIAQAALSATEGAVISFRGSDMSSAVFLQSLGQRLLAMSSEGESA